MIFTKLLLLHSLNFQRIFEKEKNKLFLLTISENDRIFYSIVDYIKTSKFDPSMFNIKYDD